MLSVQQRTTVTQAPLKYNSSRWHETPRRDNSVLTKRFKENLIEWKIHYNRFKYWIDATHTVNTLENLNHVVAIKKEKKSCK